MALPKVITSPDIEKAMQEMALCPFCGARQGLEGMRFVRIETRSRGELFYYVDCWMCGGRSPSEHSPLAAINAWNGRVEQQWTPLVDTTVLLPGGQPFSHLMLYEDGKTATFIDYIEEEVSAHKDGIAAKFDVDLGEYRISKKR